MTGMARFYIDADLLSEDNLQAVLVGVPPGSGSPSVVPGPTASAAPAGRLHALSSPGLHPRPAESETQRLSGTSVIFRFPPSDFENAQLGAPLIYIQQISAVWGPSGAFRLLL